MDNQKFFDILEKELVLALGCTEPIAIAFAVALARKYVKGKKVNAINVSASGNIIKNAMAVEIPGTGTSGINLAAALGSLSPDADKKLELLTGLTKKDIENAKKMIKKGHVIVEVAKTDKMLFIEVVLSTEIGTSKVVIEDGHTNVVRIEEDGVVILDNKGLELTENLDDYQFMNIDNIWQFIEMVDIKALKIIKDSIYYNMKIANEGIKNVYGIQVGKKINENIKKGLLGNDLTNNAMAMTAAASDARMAGCMLPVMSNSGSGNQGISCTIPVVVIGRWLKSSNEVILRAVALSHLITIYIKLKFGRLSAFCGATVSATGASCGIVYLMGGGINHIKASIQNMLANVTGMLCDGAKCGCALKLATCTNAAVQSAILAISGQAVKPTDGIIDFDPEKSINNLCNIGNFGSVEADKIILDIMIKKVNSKEC
jgi:L-cysteine desulfidase